MKNSREYFRRGEIKRRNGAIINRCIPSNFLRSVQQTRLVTIHTVDTKISEVNFSVAVKRITANLHGDKYPGKWNENFVLRVARGSDIRVGGILNSSTGQMLPQYTNEIP